MAQMVLLIIQIKLLVLGPKNKFNVKLIVLRESLTLLKLLLKRLVADEGTKATDLGEIKGNLPESCKHQDKVDVLIRPENVILANDNENKVVITARYFRGSSYLYTLKTNSGAEILCFLSSSESLQIDQSIGVQLQIEKPVFFSRS